MNSIRKLEMNRRYEDGLKLCKHWGDDFSVIKKYLASIFDMDILGVRSRLERADRFAVCDVGAGEGTITAHLVSLLLERAKKSTMITVDLIEPENSAAALLANRLSTFSSRPNLKCGQHDVSAERFFSGKRDAAYDFILASHSLYFIDMAVLQAMIAGVVRGGYLCTVLGAESSWMSYFKDFFTKRPSVHGGTFLKAFDTSVRKGDWITDRQKIETRLDLGRMWWPSPDEINDESKNMMSLILQKDFDDLSSDDRKRVHGEILAHLQKKRMMLDGDYFLSRREA